MKKKVLKICLSEWKNENRDERELSLFQEMGAEILVMSKGTITGKREIVDGFQIFRVSTRPFAFLPSFVNRVLSIFLWAHLARKFRPDIISGHDLIALFIAYLSTVFTKRNPLLIYDSHEFEIGRNSNRGKFTTWMIMNLERFLMNRCAFSIMVNDSIADEVQHIHKLADRPIVVRNIPSYWNLDTDEIAKKRAQLCNELGMAEDIFIVMYHGGIIPNRGIEHMLNAVSKIKDVITVIVGNGDDDYIRSLKKLSKGLEIENRVLFKPAVPINELYKYVGAADVGMIIVPNLFKSYYYMLPNKFFENIQSLTPVIVSDFPEIGNLTSKYGIGITVNPSDINQIVLAVKKLRDNKKFYQECKENLKQAKRELCWENESRRLREAYRKMIL